MCDVIRVRYIRLFKVIAPHQLLCARTWICRLLVRNNPRIQLLSDLVVAPLGSYVEVLP